MNLNNDQKLDRILERVSQIDVTIAAQHSTLEHHIARTLALEKRLDIAEEQFKPAVEMVSEMRGMIKLVKLIALLAGIAEAISQVVRHL